MGTLASSKISRRAGLVAVASLAASCAGSVAAPTRPTKVLFVCDAGSVKSAIAREQLRRIAAARHLPVAVSSRGIAPADHVSPALAVALASDGLDVRREPVRQLEVADLRDADVIVVFTPLPSRFGSWPVRDWTDVPSMNERYADAQRALLEKLDQLAAEIARRAPPTAR